MVQTLKRLPDWRARFDREVEAIKAMPFAWGDHDCGPGLAGRMVLAITGEDLVAPWRGRYVTAAGALDVLHEAGFDDLADMAASLLPEIRPSRARVGDLAALPTLTPFLSSLGVVNGERVFVLREDGLGTVPLLAATRAFRVG